MKNRIIKTNITGEDAWLAARILTETSVQLSDGYWESEHWKDDFWVFLEFDVKDDSFEIEVVNRSKNDMSHYGKTSNPFESMTDAQVIEFATNTAEDCYDEYPDYLSRRDVSESDFESFVKSLKKEEIAFISKEKREYKYLKEEIKRFNLLDSVYGKDDDRDEQIVRTHTIHKKGSKK